MGIVLTWLFSALGFMAAASILGRSFRLRPGFGNALLVSALFGLLNVLVGWLVFVAIGVGTLGLGFFVSGLTRWVASAVVLKLVDVLSDRLEIRGFGPALIGALVISLAGSVGEWLVR
jgi:putative membrane protein